MIQTLYVRFELFVSHSLLICTKFQYLILCALLICPSAQSCHTSCLSWECFTPGRKLLQYWMQSFLISWWHLRIKCRSNALIQHSTFFHRAEKHHYKCTMWTILVIPLIYWEKRKIRKRNMADLILKKSRKHKSLQFPWNFKKTLIDVMVQRWSSDCSYF